MWKAILVMLVMSEARVGTMAGEFPDRFLSESACEAFVAWKRLSVETPDGKFRVPEESRLLVIGHRLRCIESTEGDPA